MVCIFITSSSSAHLRQWNVQREIYKYPEYPCNANEMYVRLYVGFGFAAWNVFGCSKRDWKNENKRFISSTRTLKPFSPFIFSKVIFFIILNLNVVYICGGTIVQEQSREQEY